MEQSQKLYAMRLKVYGEGAIDTLNDGTLLAKDLMKADRLVEAESLLLKSATVSKRVHGSDLSVTKKIHSEQRRLRKQSERRAIYILPTIVSVFLLCWHIVVISLSVLTIILFGLTIILSGLTIILYFGTNVLVRVTKSIRSEQRNKQLNQALVLSIILSSILSMYKISYGVSVVLSGGVVSLYLS